MVTPVVEDRLLSDVIPANRPSDAVADVAQEPSSYLHILAMCVAEKTIAGHWFTNKKRLVAVERFLRPAVGARIAQVVVT